MRRRDFLRLVAGGLSAVQSQSLSPRTQIPQHVVTVRGPVSATRLGRTLTHEHVVVDFIGAEQVRPGRYDPEEVFAKALPHLKKLRSAGCSTLVECTPAFIGRDPELLLRLSKASGLHIVTNTGLYGAANDKFVPRYAYQETAEQLAARWISEFREGITPSVPGPAPQHSECGGAVIPSEAKNPIRPGLMKIGVDAGPLSEIDGKLVRAAAITHRSTGLAIAAHTGDGTAAMAEIELLNEKDVDPSAFIWVHAQIESNPALHHRAAEQGAWVEFDGVRAETLDLHVDFVSSMKRAGHLDRVLISQDSGWYHVGEPGGGDYRGYEFLFTHFLPALRKAGLASSEIRALVVENPRCALALRRVTPP